MTELAAGGLESVARRDPPKRVFAGLDGLRAIAALLIVLTHTGYASGETFRDPFGPFLGRAESGVAIFFVISGFLLYRPFVLRHLRGGGGSAVLRFWWRRALRIFPAYWLALTAVWLLLESAEINDVSDFVIYYGLLQIYDPLRFLGGITQAWSLCTEVSFYAFLPLFALLLRPSARRQRRAQLILEIAAIGLLFGISLGFRIWIYEVETALAPRAWAWLPANLDLFGFGMILAVIAAWAEVTRSEGRLSRVTPPAWLWWVGAAVSYWAVSIPLGLPRTFFGEVTTTQVILRQLLYGVVGLCLVAPAALAPERRGAVAAFLRSPPMAAAGLVSYGIYLWHLDIIGEAVEVLGGEITVSAPFWRLLAIALVGSILAATVSYVFVEKPILSLKNWRR